MTKCRFVWTGIADWPITPPRHWEKANVFLPVSQSFRGLFSVKTYIEIIKLMRVAPADDRLME